MIDLSLIKIIPANDSHYDSIYRMKKEAYGGYITQIWGWDEDKQKEFFTHDWQKQKPSIILYNNEPIGTVSFVKKEGPFFAGRYFIEHFYILPQYQNQGVGAYVLKHFLDIADDAGLPVNLMVLNINPSISLYMRAGFRLIETKEPFFIMERKAGKAKQQ